eukprot:scaffold40737_cov42-Cyclotella_meneghiniana.AAC.8
MVTTMTPHEHKDPNTSVHSNEPTNKMIALSQSTGFCCPQSATAKGVVPLTTIQSRIDESTEPQGSVWESSKGAEKAY